MSDFTHLDPAKLPCPYIYGAATQILGKLNKFLCSSLQLNKTYQSTMRCACGYKEALSLLSTTFPLDWFTPQVWGFKLRWASASLFIMSQCSWVRLTIVNWSKCAFSPQSFSRNHWLWAPSDPLVPSPLPSARPRPVTRSWIREFTSL